MKILVCFKIVQDLDTVMEKDWDEAALSGWDIGYTKKVINCYDEAALECALRLRDTVRGQGGQAEVTAVTIGSCGEIFYKNMFAVGIQRVLEIAAPEQDLRFSPNLVAAELARAAGGYDLILCGRQNSMGDNGATPFALGWALGIPCIPNAVSLVWKAGALGVMIERENGIRRAQLALPAVVAVGNSDTPYLRVATLREKLAVSKMKPEVWNWEEPAAYFLPPDPKPVSLFREKIQKKNRIIDGKDALAAAQELYRCWREEGE